MKMFEALRTHLNLPWRRLAMAASITVLATALGQAAEDPAFSEERVRFSFGKALPSLFSNSVVWAQPFSFASPPASSPFFAQSAAPSNWSTVEREIVAEHNRVRQNPQSYIPSLEAYLASMNADGKIPGGCGPNCTLTTREGRAAVEEAIAFLRSQQPVGPVEYSDAIASVAKSHAHAQRGGMVGHVDAQGNRSAQRLSQAGIDYSAAGENIDYGSTSAREVLISLIVDDGVASRGHRTTIFSSDWTAAGAGCGPHASIRTVYVINYAKISRQLSVVNNGTVSMRSLKVAGVDILGGPLAVGESREIAVAANQPCTVDLTIEMDGGYTSLLWDDLLICGGLLTVDADNALTLTY